MNLSNRATRAAGRTLIDLFSGAGGLTLGLRQAGFRPILAVEMSAMAAETYFRNFHAASEGAWSEHFQLDLLAQTRRGLAVHPVGDLHSLMDEVQHLVGEDSLDLLAGGPPCQGFSTAGRRNPDDARNRLVWDFLGFVKALNPKVVLIENVTGIGMNFGAGESASTLVQVREALARTGRDGYLTQVLDLNAKDFGIPQHRPRIMIVGLRRDLASRFAPTVGSSELDLVLASSIWSSSAVQLDPPLLAPASEIRPGRAATVMEAIGDLGENGYRWPLERYPPEFAFGRAMRAGDRRYGLTRVAGAEPPNNERRSHGPAVRTRFKLHLALAPFGMRRNIFSLGLQPKPVREIVVDLRELLHEHAVPQPLRLPDGSPLLDDDGLDLGINHAALCTAILAATTRKHSQRPLRGDAFAPTVMSLPDDFVHYAEPRTLTVREMARLQSFPDAFTFYGNPTTGADRRRRETPQYTQVGNAVPPLLAAAVGRHLASILERLETAGRQSRMSA